MEMDRNKFELALARKCCSITDLKVIAGASVAKVIQGKSSLRPKTLGKIAKALGVDPAELLKE